MRSLPEPYAIGKSFAITGTRQQFQKEIGVMSVKGPQALGHDLNVPALGSGRGGWHRPTRYSAAPGGRHRRLWFNWLRFGLARPAFRACCAQPVPQIVRHVNGRGVTIRRSSCHGLETDAFQFLRDCVVDLPWRANLGGGDLLQHFGYRFSLERPATRQQFVKHDAQAENVAATINPMPLASGLFGTHVGRRPGVNWSLADVLFSERQPEIDDIGLTVVADQDIARLHVPMDESLLVGVMQGVGYGRRQFRGFPVLRPLLFQPLREVGPIDKFRDNVAGVILRVADIMHRDDAGMVEIGDRASLSQIHFRIFGMRDQAGVRHLDGDGPVQLLVLSEIDKAEAPLAQHFLDAIAADPLGMLLTGSLSLRVRFPIAVVRHIDCVRFVHGWRRLPHPCPSISSPLSQSDFTGVARHRRLLVSRSPTTKPVRASIRTRFGNNLATGLAISAQCRDNVRCSRWHRNWLEINGFKCRYNVFPTPR